MNELPQAQFNGWARVEVMGHQQHIGYVRTEVYGGAVLFRIDTPELSDREYVLAEPAYVSFTEGDGAKKSKWCPAGSTVQRVACPGVSVLVGAGSIYRICPCTEDAALKAIDATERAELKLIALPNVAALPAPSNDEDDSDPYESDNEVQF